MNLQRRNNICMPYNVENESRRVHRRPDRHSNGIGCLPVNNLRQNCSDTRTNNNRRNHPQRRRRSTVSEILHRAEQLFRAAFSGTFFHPDIHHMNALDHNQNRNAGSQRRAAAERKHTAGPSLSKSAADSRTFALHHFEIGAEIGRGGMGKVLKANLKPRYQARWPDIPRRLALKVIRVTPRYKSAIENEISAHKSMNGCRHIVKYFGEFVHGQSQYIVLERLEGPSLSRAIHDCGRFSERQAVTIMKDILGALKYMHRKRIVHLDISPMNVVFRHKWVSNSGSPPQACVIDFGLASRTNQVLTTRGTPSYTAPEVIVNDTFVTHPSIDMFSAGVVLYEMLKGHSPFESSTWERQLRKIRRSLRISSEMPDLKNVSSDLKAIIASCLRWDPGRRTSADQALRSIAYCL